jgi:hypothetical protein
VAVVVVVILGAGGEASEGRGFLSKTDDGTRAVKEAPAGKSPGVWAGDDEWVATGEPKQNRRPGRVGSALVAAGDVIQDAKGSSRPVWLWPCPAYQPHPSETCNVEHDQVDVSRAEPDQIGRGNEGQRAGGRARTSAGSDGEKERERVSSSRRIPGRERNGR